MATASRAAFDWAGSLVAALQSATGAGMRLGFGYLAGGPAPFETVRPVVDHCINGDLDDLLS